MKTEPTKEKQRKANIQSGASSAVGAGIGVAAAVMSAKSAFAAEDSEVDIEPTETPSSPTTTNVGESTINQGESEVISSNNIQSQTTEPATEAPITTEESSFTEEAVASDQPIVNEEEVVSDEVFVETSQESVDVEVAPEPEIVEVTIDGTSYAFADVNLDGVADVVTVDINDNGQIDFGETVDISQEGILMSDVVEVAQQESVSTEQTDGSTLVEAEVDDMAYHITPTENDQIADIGIIDENGGGMIDNISFEDIQNQDMMATDLETMQYNSADDLASNNIPDYTNDADINDFMA